MSTRALRVEALTRMALQELREAERLQREVVKRVRGGVLEQLQRDDEVRLNKLVRTLALWVKEGEKPLSVRLRAM